MYNAYITAELNCRIQYRRMYNIKRTSHFMVDWETIQLYNSKNKEVITMGEIRKQAELARVASAAVAMKSRAEKDAILEAMADALERNTQHIIEANKTDIHNAAHSGLPEQMVDRLLLNETRIKDIADGLRSIMQLEDPTGTTEKMWTRPNGLRIGIRRVPLGVIGIIFEARPNVTADAIGLCIKSGNACILRGGKEAISSNMAIVDAMVAAGENAGLPKGAVQLIRDTSRESATKMMGLTGCIDVLIPRGGAGLINTVVENAKVPVIETGVGNCHIYVDESGDGRMATDIVVNAKCSRPSVCNSAETLLLHRAIAGEQLPRIAKALISNGVELRGDDASREICPEILPAGEQDWYEEFNDLVMAVKIVDLDGAITHINKYGSHHSDTIVTDNYSNAERFLNEVDSAAVYVNASTRFTDGYEFGFGAEIGISTQKMHARGPMGLEALTSIKYVVYGSGQTR